MSAAPAFSTAARAASACAAAALAALAALALGAAAAAAVTAVAVAAIGAADGPGGAVTAVDGGHGAFVKHCEGPAVGPSGPATDATGRPADRERSAVAADGTSDGCGGNVLVSAIVASDLLELDLDAPCRALRALVKARSACASDLHRCRSKWRVEASATAAISSETSAKAGGNRKSGGSGGGSFAGIRWEKGERNLREP